MSPKRVLITGANSGLGKDCARQLAMREETERVYLGCRNPAKAEAAKADLEKATGKEVFEIVQIDVGDLASARAAVDALPGPVDAVVLNAGGMGGPTPGAKNDEGATHMFAINVLGHAALLEGLIDAGKLTGAAIYAGSEAARGIKQMRMKRPDLKTHSVDELASVIDGSYFDDASDPMATYGPTKFVAALYMAAMARKHLHLRLVTMSPGGTSGTGAADAMTGLQRLMMLYVAMPMLKLFGMMHGLEDGTKRYLRALSDPELESGRFYGSKDGTTAGPIVDQATIFDVFGNESFQDNAYAAVHRFLD